MTRAVADPEERGDEQRSDSEREKGPAEEREGRGSKRERSAADPGEIRDRNRRIREEAAAKRRAKRQAEARRAAPARNLATSELVDDALARTTHVAFNWLKRNSSRIQWAVVLLAAGGIGWQIYSYRQDRLMGQRSDRLAQALAAERAPVSETPATGPDPLTGIVHLGPQFSSDAERLKAAEREYRDALSSLSGASATLAKLGLAGILFDQGKYAEAKTAYTEVKDSQLAKVDPDARARAVEGVGLSLEAQNQLDAALAAYRELENAEGGGSAALGLFHQARIRLAKGERDAAIEALKKALERLEKTEDKSKPRGPFGGPSFLEQRVRDLLGSLDPAAAPEPTPTISEAQIQALQEQLKASGKDGLDPQKLQQLINSLSSQSESGGEAPSPEPEPEPEPEGKSAPTAQEGETAPQEAAPPSPAPAQAPAQAPATPAAPEQKSAAPTPKPEAPAPAAPAKTEAPAPGTGATDAAPPAEKPTPEPQDAAPKDPPASPSPEAPPAPRADETNGSPAAPAAPPAGSAP